MNGFDSVFEQALKLEEVEVLIGGLRSLDEDRLADEIEAASKLLQRHECYSGGRISDDVRDRLESIGDRIGDRLWDLDSKLVALLDATG
jgi:hypothetical protein